MSAIDHLLKNNQTWAKRVESEQPGFFASLEKQQKPEYLWIGCADSRVPESQIVDLMPGDIFVHRNIANQVIHSDLNCQSVIHYAVAVLGVRHVLVCGHYNCGGVQLALDNTVTGVPDHWIRHIKDVCHEHSEELSEIDDEKARLNRACELNAARQARNVALLPVVQERWSKGQALTIHALVYSLKDGLLKSVADTIDGLEDIPKAYQHAF